jgi:hypothetical protein
MEDLDKIDEYDQVLDLKKDKTENQSMTFINIHKNESG